MSLLLCDSHVHVGWFKENYFDPAQVVKDMNIMGVQKWIFSSTSTGNIPYKEVKKEIETVNSLSEGKAYPFLWVTPEMLKESSNLRKYFFCKFHGLKIHGYNGWRANGKNLRRVFQIARELNLPVMLHTGGRPSCEAGKYLKICLEFKDVVVILAHGRPVDEAVMILKQCPLVYTDIAFMPLSDIKRLVGLDLIPQTLFGTDYPITSYYFHTPARTYYRRRRQAVEAALGETLFRQIVSNFSYLI